MARHAGRDVLGYDQELQLPYLSTAALPKKISNAFQELYEWTVSGMPVIFFTAKVTEVSSKLFPQEVHLVITEKTLYKTSREGEIQRCVPLDKIEELILSDDYWCGIRVPREFDMLIKPLTPKDSREMTDILLRVHASLNPRQALRVRRIKHKEKNVKSLLNMKKPKGFRTELIPIDVRPRQDLVKLQKLEHDVITLAGEARGSQSMEITSVSPTGRREARVDPSTPLRGDSSHLMTRGPSSPVLDNAGTPTTSPVASASPLYQYWLALLEEGENAPPLQRVVMEMCSNPPACLSDIEQSAEALQEYFESIGVTSVVSYHQFKKCLTNQLKERNDIAKAKELAEQRLREWTASPRPTKSGVTFETAMKQEEEREAAERAKLDKVEEEEESRAESECVPGDLLGHPSANNPAADAAEGAAPLVSARTDSNLGGIPQRSSMLVSPQEGTPLRGRASTSPCGHGRGVLGWRPGTKLAYLDDEVCMPPNVRKALASLYSPSHGTPVLHFCQQMTEVTASSLFPAALWVVVTGDAVYKLNKGAELMRCVHVSRTQELILSDDGWVGVLLADTHDMLLKPSVPKHGRDLADVLTQLKPLLRVRRVRHKAKKVKQLVSLRKQKASRRTDKDFLPIPTMERVVLAAQGVVEASCGALPDGRRPSASRSSLPTSSPASSPASSPELVPGRRSHSLVAPRRQTIRRGGSRGSAINRSGSAVTRSRSPSLSPLLSYWLAMAGGADMSAPVAVVVKALMEQPPVCLEGRGLSEDDVYDYFAAQTLDAVPYHSFRKYVSRLLKDEFEQAAEQSRKSMKLTFSRRSTSASPERSKQSRRARSASPALALPRNLSLLETIHKDRAAETRSMSPLLTRRSASLLAPPRLPAEARKASPLLQGAPAPVLSKVLREASATVEAKRPAPVACPESPNAVVVGSVAHGADAAAAALSTMGFAVTVCARLADSVCLLHDTHVLVVSLQLPSSVSSANSLVDLGRRPHRPLLVGLTWDGEQPESHAHTLAVLDHVATPYGLGEVVGRACRLGLSSPP